MDSRYEVFGDRGHGLKIEGFHGVGVLVVVRISEQRCVGELQGDAPSKSELEPYEEFWALLYNARFPTARNGSDCKNYYLLRSSKSCQPSSLTRDGINS